MDSDSFKKILTHTYMKYAAFALTGAIVYAMATRYICINMTIGGITDCYKYDTVAKKVVGTCPDTNCN